MSEITAWETGRALALLESGEPASQELIAYAVGVQLAIANRGLASFLVRPDYQLRTMLSRRASESLYRLGHDIWAYWVRQGYEKVHDEHQGR